MSTAMSMAAVESRASRRACETCMKGKSKCVRKPGLSTCERCARLNKECFTREHISRKRKPSKLTRSEQLEKIENKIENLVHALSAQQQSTSTEQESPSLSDASDEGPETRARVLSPPLTHASGEKHGENEGMRIWHKLCSGDGGCQNAGTSVDEDDETQTQEVRAFIETALVSDQGDILLDRFQRLMSNGCPYVVVPPGTTAKELFAQKPTLAHAIAAVTWFHDMAGQRRIAQDLMRNFSERILIKSEKSLDILQALLVFATWNHTTFGWSHQITNLFQLAIAQATDLNIGRWPQAYDRSNYENAANAAVHGPHFARGSSLEGRRAVLGIYLITSIVAISFKKIEGVKFTTWHEDCLTELEEAKEYESDRNLITMVRVQVAMDGMSHPNAPIGQSQHFSKLNLKEIQRLRASNPESETDVHLRLHSMAAEVYLWELTYMDLLEGSKTQRILRRHHVDGIYKCMDAIKRHLDFIQSIPPHTYMVLPLQTFVAYSQALMAVLRLATLEADGWDAKACREQIDIVAITGKAVQAYEEAAQSTVDGLKINHDCFRTWAAKLRWSAQLYESKFGSDDSGVSGFDASVTIPPPGGSSAIQQPSPPDEGLSGDFMAYLDDAFWSTFTGEMDLGFNDFSMAGQGF